MNISNDYKNRQIIPRWYPFQYARSMGEITGERVLEKPQPSEVFSYKLKQAEWEEHNQLPLAVDFVATALILNDFENEKAKKAAQFILANKTLISNLSVEAAELFLRNGKQTIKAPFELQIKNSQQRIHSQIANLKKNTRNYPMNAIPWADLTFYYTLIGQTAKAHKCAITALSLGHENRFILRSIARFFLHINEPDQALYHLRAADVTWNDPWLLASEVSISEAFKLRSKTLREAKNVALSSDHSPKDLTELFGALGTLEANNGEQKKSKKLFARSLEDPNENTFAQAEWIAPQIGLNVDRQSHSEIDALFEANARLYLREGEFEKSLEEALKWLRLQPFSSKPAVHATYIVGVCQEDHEKTIRIIQEDASLLLEEDMILKNNYAFSLASLDRVVEAEQQLPSIKSINSLPEREQATIGATKGLIEFRKGNTELGRQLYMNAIDVFKKLNEQTAVAVATYFLAREEIRQQSPAAVTLMDKAQKLALKLGLKELQKKNFRN